LWSGRDDF